MLQCRTLSLTTGSDGTAIEDQRLRKISLPNVWP